MGKQGWTFVKLDQVNPIVFEEALKAAYCEVANIQLVEFIRNNDLTE